MNRKNLLKEKEEYKILASCIFKGMSNNDIARELNYSRSCIAYKINKLFNTFNVNSRTEFIIQTLNKLINSKQNQLISEIEKSEKLFQENQKLKRILKDISKNQKIKIPEIF